MSTTAVITSPAAENHAFPPAESQPESIRRQNLKAERNIRMIGTCFVVSGSIGIVALAIPVLLQIFLATMAGDGAASGLFRSLSVNLVFALIPAIFVKSGVNLRRLKAGSRLGGIVLSCLTCLCFFPFGLAIGIAGLVILGGKQATTILSVDYEDVLSSKTPHLSGRNPWLIPTAYGLVTVLYLVGIGLIVMGNLAKIASQV